MDITIRKNEHCIIGLPRCDFVFSSTRSCFIGYGFEQSPMEVEILKNILEAEGILAEEAGGQIKPAQSAFCAKICSKIITSQFCIVLLNNDEKNGIQMPNANVNMEYGLMLGFNKYVIPFQNETHKLPFNVAGLDTIKYSKSNFSQKAKAAVSIAIRDTSQEKPPSFELDQIIDTFLAVKEVLVSSIDSAGDRNIFRLGQPFGFHLLNDFSGINYMFFGNFTQYRPEIILWRVEKLDKVLRERINAMDFRIKFGVATEDNKKAAEELFSRFKIWIVVTRNEDKKLVLEGVKKLQLDKPIEVFSLKDIQEDVDKMRSIELGSDYVGE